MSIFFFVAFLMLATSLAVLLYGLTKPVNLGSNPVDVNVEIAKENKRSLEHALASGELTQEGFDVELQQLESALANNISAAPTKAANSRGQWVAAGLMVLGIPLAAGLLYLKLGSPAAINAMAQKQEQQQTVADPSTPNAMPPLAELLPNVEERLKENPDDVKGWKLLGRSYLMIGNFDKAVAASRRALELDDQDPDILAQLAESIAMQQEGEMQGEPTQFTNAALALSPNHQQSTWLSAIADQQQGEHSSAIEKFETLLPSAQNDPRSLQSINEMLAVSKAALGEAASTTTQSSAPATAPAATAGSSITVKAALSESISPDLPDTTAVFIYARASSGPPMPLAVARLQLKDLPVEVTLDDSMAMVPGMTISAFTDVVIGARLSPSGNAIRQSGDWMGETVGIKVGSQDEAVLVTIDQQVE